MPNFLRLIFSSSSSVSLRHVFLWNSGWVEQYLTADVLIAVACCAVAIALSTALLIALFDVVRQRKDFGLKQLNEELQASQARFSGILDIASDAIISVDANQRITLFNRAAEKVFGYTVEEALGQPLSLLVPQRFASSHHHHVHSFKEQNGATRRMGDRSEIFGRRKDGSEFPAEASISRLEVAGEKIFTAFLRDISERKQVEAELQEQQRFLRQVIDTNPSIIFVKDWEGRFTLANQAVATLYNTTVEELMGKTDADFSLNPAEIEQYRQADRQVMSSLQPLLNIEEQVTTLEGTLRYFQSTKTPLVSTDGQTRYVLGVANDVTALKQTEAALQQKTEELEGFFSSAIDLLCIANAQGCFLRLNPEWERTLGYCLQDLEGKRFLDFVHPDDLEPTLTAIAQLSKHQPIQSFVNRYRHQEGSYRWLEWRSIPRGNYIYAAARDISDRKRAEEELRLSQERLQLALEASGEGLWDWQIDSGDVYRSRRYLEILGYDDEELPRNVRSWETSIHPDDKSRVLDLLNAHFQDASVQFACEYRMQTKLGGWIWIADYGKVVTRDGQGQPLRMIGTYKDISDRKQAEAALRASEERWRYALEGNGDGLWDWNTQTNELFLSRQWKAMLGFSEEEVGSDFSEWDKRVHPDDKARVYVEIEKHFQGEVPHYVSEYQILCKNGTYKWVLDRGMVMGRAEDGKPIRLMGTLTDISDRKQAEERLRQSEITKRAMLQAIPDLLIRMMDDGTQLELINQGCVRFLGIDKAFVGSNIADLLPAPIVHERLRCANQALTTGEVQVHEYQLTIEGQHYYEEARIAPLQGNEVLLMVRDITVRKQMERALRESESQFRTLLEDLQVGVVVHDMQAKIVLCNSKAMELLGLTESQLLGKTSFDPAWNVIYEDGSPFPGTHHPSVQAIATGRSVRNVIMGVYRPQLMDRVWLLVDAEPRLDEAGTVQQVIVTFSNISDRQAALRERERTEERLRQSEERLRQAIKAAKFGTWEYNFLTNELFQSDISELYGLEPGHTHRTYEEWKAQIHPEDRDWVQAEFDRAIQDGKEFEFEFRLVRPDGTVRWSRSPGRVVHDPAGQPSYAYGIAADITDRKLADVEQEAQQAFLRQVIDTVPNIIFVKDKTGRILIVNQAGADAHGTTVEAMLGRRETDFNPNFSFEQLEDFLAVNQQVMQTRQPHIELSQSIVTAMGKRRWYQTVIKPLIDVNGQVIGIVGATTDITDLKQIEQALQQAKEAAETANKAKSVFLANMSHELRTPLNVILGFVQVMQRDALLSSEQRENLHIIRRSGDHLLNLINDVLDLSKIEAGHITLNESQIDLIDSLRSLEQMFRQRAEAKGLQLCLELGADLPQYVKTDANKLRQVLINLLGNAIKFTQQGQVTLRVGVKREEGLLSRNAADLHSFNSVVMVQFEVIDTGVGIHPIELQTIFSAFVQTKVGKISPDGTGLGLTISRKFVQLLGGEITVDSLPGEGSTFAFTIPVHLAQSADRSITPSGEQVIGLAPNQPTYRILVVDDQPENRKLLVKLLTQIGLEVREAANGQEAVTQWQQWQPHLIYMDIRMPLLNGYEATQQIRATADGQNPIIIALTAQASRSDRTLALSAGCNDYLTKPFQEEVLFGKMAEYLGIKYLCVRNQATSLDEELPTAFITLHPADLSTMPADWIAALHQAARLCDDSGMEQLIQQIPAEQTVLIKGLRQLVQTYSFSQIVVLTAPGAAHDHV